MKNKLLCLVIGIAVAAAGTFIARAECNDKTKDKGNSLKDDPAPSGTTQCTRDPDTHKCANGCSYLIYVTPSSVKVCDGQGPDPDHPTNKQCTDNATPTTVTTHVANGTCNADSCGCDNGVDSGNPGGSQS